MSCTALCLVVGARAEEACVVGEEEGGAGLDLEPRKMPTVPPSSIL